MAKRRIIRTRDIGADPPDEAAPESGEPSGSGIEFVGGCVGRLVRADAQRYEETSGLKLPLRISLVIELAPIPKIVNSHGVASRLSRLEHEMALKERLDVVAFINVLVGKQLVIGSEGIDPIDEPQPPRLDPVKGVVGDVGES